MRGGILLRKMPFGLMLSVKSRIETAVAELVFQFPGLEIETGGTRSVSGLRKA